jgi:hypothetical protein
MSLDDPSPRDDPSECSSRLVFALDLDRLRLVSCDPLTFFVSELRLLVTSIVKLSQSVRTSHLEDHTLLRLVKDRIDSTPIVLKSAPAPSVIDFLEDSAGQAGGWNAIPRAFQNEASTCDETKLWPERTETRNGEKPEHRLRWLDWSGMISCGFRTGRGLVLRQ